jgi:hypothetical protein
LSTTYIQSSINILLSRLTPYAEEITGTINVCFDITGQLLIIHSSFIKFKFIKVASKKIGLEVNAEKTKYKVMSRDQNAGQNGNIHIGNKLYETVEEFKYLGTTLTNQNYIQEEIKGRLKSGNACYHSVQNLLSSSLLSKSVKIKIYKTIILPDVLYGCEACSITLRKECMQTVFENRVLRRLFGLTSSEVAGEWRRLHNKELYALYS